jgi:hypothetical protein
MYSQTSWTKDIPNTTIKLYDHDEPHYMRMLMMDLNAYWQELNHGMIKY